MIEVERANEHGGQFITYPLGFPTTGMSKFELLFEPYQAFP